MGIENEKNQDSQWSEIKANVIDGICAIIYIVETLKTLIWIFTLLMGHKVCPCKGARGVMVIVVGNDHGDTSSNPERDWLHFT